MEKLSLDEVGWFFVQEYYTFLNREPGRLHCFYTKKSTFIHGNEGESIKSCSGQQEIHKKIIELGFSDCKVLISNVDSQASANGGIVIQVLGEMSNCDGPSRRFAQTFFLAEQPNGYFVLNDIFRYLKEDIEDGELCNGECHSHILNSRKDELSSCAEINNNAQLMPQENYTASDPVLLRDDNVNLNPIQLCKIVESEQKSNPALSAVNTDHKVSYEKLPSISLSDKMSSAEQASDSTQNITYDISQSQSTAFQPSISSGPKTWANLFDKTPAQINKNTSVKPTVIHPQTVTSVERVPSNSSSVFVKNVKDRISEISLKQAMSRFGTVCHIEMKREKNCALVYYEAPVAASSAIAANTIKIDQDMILIEERRNNRERNRNINGDRRNDGREHTKYGNEKRVGNDRRGYVNKNRGHDKK